MAIIDLILFTSPLRLLLIPLTVAFIVTLIGGFTAFPASDLLDISLQRLAYLYRQKSAALHSLP